MAWANLVRSTRAVFSGNKICSKHSDKASPVFLKGDKFETYKDKANKVSQFARRFNYNFVGMVNRSHRFYSTVPSSAISENSHPFLPKGSGKASPILPMGDDIFQTFTDKAKEVIKFAQMETRPFGYKFVGTEMILLGLIGNGTGKFLGECTDIAEMVLLSMNIRLKDARIKVKEMFGCSGPPSISVPVEIPFRPSALRAFQLALAEAQQLGHNYIGSEHLLLGLLGDEDANLLLEELGASPVEICKQVRKMIKEKAAQVVGDGSSGNETPTLVEYVELADEKKVHPFVQGNNKMPTLEGEDGEPFALNLTEDACQEDWKPVVERKPLINTLIQILGRRSENNAFLVGEKGVGKSCVLLGLVQTIRDLDVPNFLSKKKVICLTECTHPQFKLQDLMEEVKKCNDIIIYIDDEISSLLYDIESFAKIMMPAVASGGVQCVISGTPDAYLRMKNCPKLERLFHPMSVPSTTVNETIEILKGLQNDFEMAHKVRYTDEALVAAVHMSDKYLRHGFQPLNARALMDLAGVFVFKKELPQVRDQELGHKMDLLQIQRSIERKPPIVTKADVEDLALEVLRLNVTMTQVFGSGKSYYELFQVVAYN